MILGIPFDTSLKKNDRFQNKEEISIKEKAILPIKQEDFKYFDLTSHSHFFFKYNL